MKKSPESQHAPLTSLPPGKGRITAAGITLLLSLTAGLTGRDAMAMDIPGPPLDDSQLATLTGRYELPSGIVLMFGLAQSMAVDGVQHWRSDWNVELANGQISVPTVTPDTRMLQNQVDAVTLQQWQRLTVEINRMGDPALSGMASRLSRLVVPGLP